MRQKLSQKDKELKISFEGLKKVRPLARLNRDPKMLLLNNVAADLVQPIEPYYKVGVDPGGYQGTLYLIPSQTPTQENVRFHGGDRHKLARRLYIGNLIYNIEGFRIGESNAFTVKVQYSDGKRILVLKELIYN